MCFICWKICCSSLNLTCKLVSHWSLSCLFLRNSSLLWQGDDVKLYDNQTEYWKIYPLSADIVDKHGWQNSRILKTTSQGLGKLTAALSYFSEHHETKEVVHYIDSFYFFLFFNLKYIFSLLSFIMQLFYTFFLSLFEGWGGQFCFV